MTNKVKGFNETVFEDLKSNIHPVIPLKPVISVQKYPECKFYIINTTYM